MNNRTLAATRSVMAVAGLLVVAVPVTAQERPIERWLLSRPFPAASVPENSWPV